MKITVIEYKQFIKAPVELCFDLKRSVTTAKTKEIAVDGITEGYKKVVIELMGALAEVRSCFYHRHPER
ncbi:MULTISPECIES: hypothetical protein [Peribacillus]|uniref:hypothetical protein n=1 Tax=Peribacillus TaxID=2675229 RepID=UPI001F4F03E6|nr:MULTISPECIES: hypothetical protein [unclassified Peribacillus]MCK1981416.1 hypothetical protein [Peribacillus sp. Aquil_B1]MCK2006837.1 hypothetical protein [Peribacillus sp. Aquil_B8]